MTMMDQQHPDCHPGPVVGPLPGLRDPRPGRLREALAARANAKSSLRARRAERLARIRDGITVLAADSWVADLAELPAVPPRRAVTGAPLCAEASAVPPVPDEIFETPPRSEIVQASLRPETTSPPLRGKIVEPAPPGGTVASPLRGAYPIPREIAEAPAREDVGSAGQAAADDDDSERDSERDIEALERFLAGLVGALEAEPVPQPARLASPVVALDRACGQTGQAAEDAGGLARLPGAGPGLVAALARAGISDLAALARLDPETLAARLGPIGRLIDLETWIAVARAETAGPAAASAS